MKKNFIFVILVTVLFGGLTACEKKPDAAAGGEHDSAVTEGSKSTDAEPDEMQNKDDPKKDIPAENDNDKD